MVSTADVRTYVYGATYDSWNRVRTMIYPDGEVVTYAYNAAGQIASVKSNKQGKEETIVEKVGYDKDGHTVYTKLGNGTETTYTYDKQRERLQEMNLTAAGTAIMTNKYQYDAVDNILGITNAVDPTQANSNNNNSNNNKAKLGGAFNHTYAYDDLNRLIKANGKAKSATYEMQMTFGRMSEPLTKVQKVDSTKTAQSYGFTYKYEDSNHPTAPTQIGHEHYTYDANGNPTLVENDSLGTERRMYWDEDNRLMVLSDNGKTSRYTYNAAGERIIKSHGDLEGVYINGAPQGMTFHETEDYTIYPAPIITVTKNRFTKHYFIGDKRVASKLGVGKFSNVYGISGNNVTAGQKDYATRMMQIEKQREEYYKSLGTPPGVPTMKGATADPDNTGHGYNDIIGDLGDHSVPEGWVQRPKFNEKGDVPGPPIQWQKPEDPDNAQPGYGYIPVDTTNIEDIFFYHSDHLGSTSYITDAKANITQFDAYLPYGELLVDEHSSSEDMPYKFNGKELDQETGLYYYGARYMNPMTSLWYGVDALTEKYPSIGGYVYCAGNPVRLIDTDGNKIVDHTGSRVAVYINKQGKVIFTKFVTNDIKRIVNSLMLTKEGMKSLKQAINSTIRVKMRISEEAKIEKVKKGYSFTYGETIQGNFNPKDNYGRRVNKDGTLGITESSITIYEGTIENDAKTENPKHKGLTIEQAIGAVAGHEIVHATNRKEINKDLKYEKENKGGDRSDKETVPNKIENTIIEQSRKLNIEKK
nr:RHS repeat-associated core domain-containing protein [Segatella maculosa]